MNSLQEKAHQTQHQMELVQRDLQERHMIIAGLQAELEIALANAETLQQDLVSSPACMIWFREKSLFVNTLIFSVAGSVAPILGSMPSCVHNAHEHATTASSLRTRSPRFYVNIFLSRAKKAMCDTRFVFVPLAE